MLDIIVSKLECSQCPVYIISCTKRGIYLSVSEIKNISFKKMMLFTFLHIHFLKLRCM